VRIGSIEALKHVVRTNLKKDNIRLERDRALCSCAPSLILESWPAFIVLIEHGATLSASDDVHCMYTTDELISQAEAETVSVWPCQPSPLLLLLATKRFGTQVNQFVLLISTN
jgi:hypothetical protein